MAPSDETPRARRLVCITEEESCGYTGPTVWRRDDGLLIEIVARDL